MARKQFNDGQEVVFGDQNEAQALREQELYDRVIFEMLQRKENAFFQTGFKVSFVGPTTVNITAGLGFQTDATVADTEPTKRLLYRPANLSLNITAPHGSLPRIDKVVVKHARAASKNENRKYKATIMAAVTTQAFDVENDWLSDILIVAGTPNASPVAPATPSGYLSIAELAVAAVTGLSGSGDITDTREQLPIGPDIFIDTSTFQRLTVGASIPISQLLSEIDALLKNGYQQYTDYDVLGADPAAPAASKVRLYHKGGVWYSKDESAVITPIGSGGGGGGGAVWYPNPDGAPTEDDGSELGEKVWLFAPGAGTSQKLKLALKVPQSYIAGRAITMYLARYSPSASSSQNLTTVSTLIRSNIDSVLSTTNQRTSSSTLINASANRYRQGSHTITDASGQINGVAVNPGDLILIDVYRDTDTDSADLRMIPSSTEVTFS